APYLRARAEARERSVGNGHRLRLKLGELRASAAERVGREQPVIVEAIGERHVNRLRVVVAALRGQRAGAPVTPHGLLLLVVGKRLDAALHVRECAYAQRRAY